LSDGFAVDDRNRLRVQCREHGENKEKNSHYLRDVKREKKDERRYQTARQAPYSTWIVTRMR
jgi:hypothetical protein